MLLAIDTALASLSVALCDGDRVVAARHAVIGRGHAEALLPMVAEVMGSARPSQIVVTVGPGSFTGLRVGIAAARALGLAWGAPVAGVTSTALIAAAAFALDPALAEVAAVVDAGRGQLCWQRIRREAWVADTAVTSVSPEAAAVAVRGIALAGPAAAAVAGYGQGSLQLQAWPDAADARRVPLAARSLPPLPLYVRPPDAKLPL